MRREGRMPVAARRKLESRKGGAGVLGRFWVPPTCTKPAGMVCLVVIPAPAGMYYINHWIPAFAGMTAGAIGIFGQLLILFPSTRHSSLP